ncbi:MULTISPECIES: DUF4123 domain-containing protein [Pseudomonas]|uniref:DUF4123 domain-containing protein n=1 Tax=Pseudomonas frederiksbergensis TaxID=104087 RepID=A0A6L5BKU2_9PSED|nr:MULTISPECIES: DUF4123 domain-containing protein [Pseudomonas]KAF2389276.1 hypothetical protein FX983_03715 [Pseudomonas frederiksbergensis]UZE11902.1 DUF4123 domain-containing protein [Pseudomonas sp. B21-053]
MNPVEQWLRQQTRAGRDLYLMLDSDGQMDERTALISELGVDRHRNLYVGTPASALAQSGPLLFQIDPVGHPVIRTLLDTPERNWGWLASASHVDLDVLAAHWRERVITGERPNLAVYRAHDNRILGRALAHLQPEQYADFLGPMASVCYWDAGQWRVADNPDPGEHPLPAAPPWLQTPTPEQVYANILFDNARRYLIGEHTEAMAALAEQLDVEAWLWGHIQLTRLWGWQQPEQVHFLLTQSLKTPGYLPPKSWLPKPEEDPATHFERVYQQVLYWQGDAPL